MNPTEVEIKLYRKIKDFLDFFFNPLSIIFLSEVFKLGPFSLFESVPPPPLEFRTSQHLVHQTYILHFAKFSPNPDPNRGWPGLNLKWSSQPPTIHRPTHHTPSQPPLNHPSIHPDKCEVAGFQFRPENKSWFIQWVNVKFFWNLAPFNVQVNCMSTSPTSLNYSMMNKFKCMST